MTPLLASGLSLVQGNSILFCNAVGTVARGFVLALGIATLLGCVARLVVPTISMPTAQMMSRCSPTLLDLWVAFFSGVAAAYASGRPNLVSALPGVAIAAALVPPIATAGICLSQGLWPLAGGALLLFITNIGAIALGTAFSTWCVGIRGSHAHGPFAQWSRWAGWALVALIMMIGWYEWRGYRSASPRFREELAEQIRAVPTFELADLMIDWHDGIPSVRVVVEGGGPLPDAARDAVATSIRGVVHSRATIAFETRHVDLVAPPEERHDGAPSHVSPSAIQGR